LLNDNKYDNMLLRAIKINVFRALNEGIKREKAIKHMKNEGVS